MADLLILAPPSLEAERLRDLLKAGGCAVRSASTLAEGVRLLRTAAPRAVFCAFSLPDGGIFDLLKELSGRCDAPPVVVIADFAKSRNAAEAMKAGAIDFLPFPLDPAEASACVARLLAGESAVRADLVRFEARDGILIIRLPEEMSYEATRSMDVFGRGGMPTPEAGVIIDLSGTLYFSSSGISSLFLVYIHYPSLHGRILIAGAKPQVANAIRLAGIHQFFAFADTVDEAIAKMGK